MIKKMIDLPLFFLCLFFLFLGVSIMTIAFMYIYEELRLSRLKNTVTTFENA
jgi:hypothetical protein